LAEALNTKAVLFEFQGRREEAMALIKHALEVALANDLSAAALRAYNNLGAFLFAADRYAEVRAIGDAAVELARRVGDRAWESVILSGGVMGMVETGDWAEALEIVEEMGRLQDLSPSVAARVMCVVPILVYQGRCDDARELLETLSDLRDSEELQARSGYAWAEAVLLNGEGDSAGALEAAERSLKSRQELGILTVKGGLVEALEAAMHVDRGRAEDLLSDLEKLRPGESSPYIAAHLARFRARMSAGGDDAGFRVATASFRRLSTPFWLAVTLLEYGESLTERGRIAEAEPLLAESQEIFNGLQARPWQERLARAARADSVAAS
jgi:tetratricopeptide (TPR) repeat protein